MSAAPPSFATLFDKATIPTLAEITADQERRVLYQLRLLRSGKNGGKLIVEFQGSAMLLSIAAPAGKVE